MKDQQVNNKPNDTKSIVGKGGCPLEGDADHNDARGARLLLLLA
jgi:hypothetical protein